MDKDPLFWREWYSLSFLLLWLLLRSWQSLVDKSALFGGVSVCMGERDRDRQTDRDRAEKKDSSNKVALYPF